MSIKNLKILLVMSAFLGVTFLVFYYMNSRFILSEDAKYSYQLGNDVAKNFIRQGIKINTTAYFNGFKDGLTETSKIAEQEQAQILSWAQNEAKQQVIREEQERRKQVKIEIEKIKANPLMYESIKKQWDQHPNDPRNPFQEKKEIQKPGRAVAPQNTSKKNNIKPKGTPK